MKPKTIPPLAPQSGGSSYFLRIMATCAAILLAQLAVAFGEEQDYYSFSLDELPLDEDVHLSNEGYRQTFQPRPGRRAAFQTQLFPYVWIESEGEAYVAPVEWSASRGRLHRTDLFLAVNAAPEDVVRGILFYPFSDPEEGFARLPFEITPKQFADVDRREFLQIKANHYERLAMADFVGGAWFRRQWHDARQEDDLEPSSPRAAIRPRRETSLEETFNLFSGGRAISENLALDESLDLQSTAEKATQPISEIRGIDIREYNWNEMWDEAPATLDSLARLIPSDQHGLFFRDGLALIAFLEEWQENGLPLLGMLESASVPAGLVERYSKQLGFSTGELAEFAAGKDVGAIAITGGDPFFPTGTDVAIVLETSEPTSLLARLEKRFRAIADREADVTLSRSDEPVPTLALTSPDRRRSARITIFEKALLLTNSPSQVDAVSDVASGDRQAMVDLDEYLFFRDRYPVSDDKQAGFLLLTDDAIRRWCGPEWRIGSSRRLRAAALLSDQIARHLPALAAGETPAAPEVEADGSPWLGDLVWTATGPRSAHYGHLGFLTPVSELKIKNASRAEALAYERWRNGYEAEWQQFFDPIAIRFSLASDRIDADLTVMPLTASSEYRRAMELAGDVEIAEGSGDPRSDALLQIALAADPESEPMRRLAGMGQMFGADLNYNAMAWMEGTVSLYFDEDLVWQALEEARDTDRFLMQNLGRLPVALHIDSKDPTRLTLFLSGLRTMLEQSAPGMMRWETREHNDQAYVAILPAESPTAMNPGLAAFSLFYSARPDAFVISPNEDVIRRSIDRYAERREDNFPADVEWLGRHLNLSLQRKGLSVVQSLFEDDYQAHLTAVARAPIPLLNDWRARFPDRDPIELSREIWRVDPECPVGGKYVWNNEYKTYESTRLGSAAAPSTTTVMPAILHKLARVRLGVSFEDDGIRARGILHRQDPKKD